MRFIKIVAMAMLLFGGVGLFAKEITLNFQNMPIEDVVKFVAKQKKINILLNEHIGGNVNFLSNKPISDAELLPLLEHILLAKGYSLSKNQQGYYSVVRAANASKEVAVGKRNGTGMEMVVWHPKYTKPSVIAKKIAHLASQYALITSDDKMGLLIISDYAKNIKNMQKLLTLFDTHLKRDLQRVVIKNYNVNKMLPQLVKIFQATKSDYNGEIKLVGDVFQNAIWVSANSSDMKRVVALIKNFDVNTKDSAKMQTKIIFLHNANEEDIIKTVQEIVKSRDVDKPVKSVVSANKELNAIIISSTAEQIQDVESLVKELDVERKQVFVKVQIFEVSNNKLKNLGIKWGAAGGYASNGIITTANLNLGGSSFVLPSILSQNLDLAKVASGAAFGATVDFLHSEGALSVLSEPNLLSVNNLKSSIYVGKTQSIKTSDATGSNSLDVTRNTYTREDIGLTLEITPQITDSDNVVLKILVNVEDIDPSSPVADQPTTTKRKVDTVAIVQNEKSVIIGGLIRNSFSHQVSKVPILGDMPFLGALFRSKQDSQDQISTIMVITPYIVKNSRDLAKLQKKLRRLNQIEHSVALKIKEFYENRENNASL